MTNTLFKTARLALRLTQRQVAEQVRARIEAVTGRERAAFPTGETFHIWHEEASSIPVPTQSALPTLEWVGRRRNLCVVGPSGTGRSHFSEALGQSAVDAGMTVAWFTIEDLGVLIRRHRVDESVSKAISRITRTDLIIVDLCRDRDYAEGCRHRSGVPA
ncbi:ATP-binding protein [Kitasatospora sp. NPDC051705]|uniref:ATP-binding protein n=1 Tax=Kitasatospora sp. NPDC051705 TaxID=3364057 RepID=UPI003797816F